MKAQTSFSRPARLLLLLLLLGCGGESGPGPQDAVVTGTWIATFTSDASVTCQLSQLSFIVSEAANGAANGSHGGGVITCPGDNFPFSPGAINWSVSGNAFTIRKTGVTGHVLTGTVNGASFSGTFGWGIALTGTFTANRQ